jgi:hypothetical protein
MAERTILDTLREYQASEGFDDRGMANHLRIPYETWRHTRAGRIPLRNAVLRAALKRHIITAAQAGLGLLEDDNDNAAPIALPFDESGIIAEKVAMK